MKTIALIIAVALPTFAMASGPNTFFDDPHITEPESDREGICPAHSDRGGEPYVKPWVRDCYNNDREPDVEPEKPTDPCACPYREEQPTTVVG